MSRLDKFKSDKWMISKRVSGKEGSFTVFAAMLFASVLLAVIAALNAALQVSEEGMINSLGKLWGKSLLGEYDIFLKERYGIFGFYGYDYLAEEKLRFYSQYSFSDKRYIDVDEIWAHTGKYSLAGTDMLKEQIQEAVLYGAVPKKYKTSYIQDENSGENGRHIENEWIRKGLPSYGKTDRLYLTELIQKIKSGISAESLAGNAAADRYIFDFFKNKMTDDDLGDTFFNCETEYIISGKLSDTYADRDVRTKIKTVRNMLNLIYLYGCAEKRQAVLAMAQAVTPGPAALLTQAVMMETWAYMEAENDINILYSGKTVPLLKKDCNWALSLENVFGSGKEGSCVMPQVVEGEEYKDYLGILLAGLTEETKLLRIADLIQINGKYLYCDSFLIKDYCVGLEYGITVNDHECIFEETY